MIINVEKKLVEYIEALEQENKQLKEKIKRRDEFIKYQQQKIDKAIDKLYCYGEVFDSKILQQFQREMIEILGDKENE